MKSVVTRSSPPLRLAWRSSLAGAPLRTHTVGNRIHTASRRSRPPLPSPTTSRIRAPCVQSHGVAPTTNNRRRSLSTDAFHAPPADLLARSSVAAAGDETPLRTPLEYAEARLTQRLADDADHDVKREDFLVVLRLLVEAAATPGAAVRAERWLGRLEKLAVAHDDDDELASALRPTTECYRLVIATWASAKRESPQIIVARAERWLNKGLDSAVEEQQPDTATWNAFLDAVSKGRAHKGAKALTTVRDHAIQAQETLERMLEDQRQHGSGSRMAPDTDSFNYVMRAWTRCRRATDIADRTMDALRALEDYQRRVDPNVGPNTKSYGMVLDSLSCRAMQKVKAFAHQNHQHANSPSPDSYRPGDATDTAENGLDEMEMMEGVLAHMLQHQQRQGSRVAMQATTFLYNTIITAWAHLSRVHEHGPSAAERVLQLMTRYADEGKTAVKPDALSYQLVMRAWNNSGLPHRAQRAAWWLSTQWQDYEFDGDLQRRPTTKCYNAVIRVFADTGEPVKAEEILRELMAGGPVEADRVAVLEADSESFSFVIKGWAAAATADADLRALKKAVEWLDFVSSLEDKEEGIKLPGETYRGILAAARACASQSPETLQVALDVFRKLMASHHPVDGLEYSRLLQCGILALSRPEQDDVRGQFLQDLFRNAAEAGLVNGPLLRTLANGAIFYDGWTADESWRWTRLLVGEWPLPPNWTRNIKQDGFLPIASDLRRTNFRQKGTHGSNPYGWK